MYFEYNLSGDLSYLDSKIRKQVEAAVEKVSCRMDKLEEALEMSFMKGETFAKFAKVLFDSAYERFEKMTADELCQYIDLVSVGCEDEPDRMVWPNAEVVVDRDFVRNEEWEFIRHLGTGGSDGAPALNLSPYTTPRGLCYEKWGTPELTEQEDKGKEAIFARGHFIEPNVIKAFCRLTGATEIRESRMFRSKKYPMVTANMDAVLDIPGQGICVFEAKTSILENSKNWKDAIPRHYVPQMRQYMAVMNDDRIKGCYIGCIFTDDIKIDDVFCGAGYNEDRSIFHFLKRDKEIEEEYLEEISSFWNEYVLTHTLPPRSGNPKLDLKDLRTFEALPDPSAPEKIFDISEKELIDLYLDLGAKKKEASDLANNIESQQALVKEKLLLAMGSATVGKYVADDRTFTVSNKEIKGRSSTDTKKLKEKYPDAYEECVKEGNPSYRFSITSKNTPKNKESAA